jgi:hypothetical protein
LDVIVIDGWQCQDQGAEVGSCGQNASGQNGVEERNFSRSISDHASYTLDFTSNFLNIALFPDG